ncbi:alkaline phosphatase D family protein [Solimonas terrae]|uniref:Alkaline phosphatase n=1 Tax=Solimonas terrae TaxID=1396819 RepID=A0A6M2BMA7_9GAMM|nr:alkaline phosphatase D family protein [Solimonas terrae]NGY03440.1 hypothetical protein [Solimonas terrae]
MSGPRKPRRRGYSRRAFLKKAGLSSAAVGLLPMLPGCGHSDGLRSGGALEFRHGVASGDPLSDRVVLWTRISGVASDATATVDYVVARDPQLGDVVKHGSVQTSAQRDFTVKVDATGLQPATTYYYRFHAGDLQSPIGRTRTLPVGSVDRLRIGVVSCASLAHGYFNAYGRLAERADLDLIVHLGDYIYEYGSGQYGNLRAYEPEHEILTLDDYRTRYAQYRGEAELQAMHRQHALINIWDDHETADNSWKDGAYNHNEGEGDWAVRVSGALQAFYEWQPTRELDAGQPRKDYRSFQFGDLVQLTMLEERLLARDQQVPGVINLADTEILLLPIGEVQNADRQMIGSEQEAWLSGQLRQSPAKWKLIGQGVMFGQLKIAGLPNLLSGGVYVNPDQWDGYPAARGRVFDIIDGGGTDAAIDNVVVLTGDIHSSWCMDLTRDPNDPLAPLGGYNPLDGAGAVAVEFVCTSITSPGLDSFAPIKPLIPVLNPHIKYSDFTRKGYLLLDITPQRVIGEHWYVDTITQPSTTEAFGAAYQTADGDNHMSAAEQTSPRSDAPAFAP